MSVRLFDNKDVDASLLSIVDDDGEICFKGKDVAIALGYLNPNSAIQRHVSDKYKFEYSKMQGARNAYLHPQTLILTEPGLCELIFSSHLPRAVAFRDWVFSEVLPSIRKTGSYLMDGLRNTLNSATRDTLLSSDRDRKLENRVILEAHADIVKDPNAAKEGEVVV